jgi:hypothetical protein
MGLYVCRLACDCLQLSNGQIVSFTRCLRPATGASASSDVSLEAACLLLRGASMRMHTAR